jgi:sulfite exporter TauE/SafE
MDAALITSAALLGLAGTPHCAAMCAAPCAAVCGEGRGSQAAFFQLARVLGYALAGAAASASVGALATVSQLSPALRPLWVLLHVSLLVLGLWMLWHGRQPAWMSQVGRLPAAVKSAPGPQSDWAPLRAPVGGNLRAGTAGLLWVAWPCGLLQTALVLASLTGGAAAGAATMATFAVASSSGLVLAPTAWRWLSRSGKRAGWERSLVRAGGAMVAVGSAFALGMGVWHEVAAYCGLA